MITITAAIRCAARRLRPLYLTAFLPGIALCTAKKLLLMRPAGGGRARKPRAERDRGASLMTLLERQFYLDPQNTLNVTYGYPEGLSPEWVISYQRRPPDDFLSVPPARYSSVIAGYFQRLFRSGNVALTPTCSLAFVIAARALIRSASDEIIMLGGSYDSHPLIVASLGAKTVYASRTATGSISMASLSERYTQRTRAIVLCCPENPLGTVYSREEFEHVIAFCKQRDLTLVVDNCLAELSPFGVSVPLVSHLNSSKGLSFLLLGDTSKILGLGGSKFGAIIYSDGWQALLEAAQSPYFFQYSQYDLYLLSVILSDRRLAAYLEAVNGQIAGNYRYLQQNLSEKFHVLRMDAGCFCLIDIGQLGLDDVACAALLRDRYFALVVPGSYFDSRQHALVRVSLARPAGDISRLVQVMNSAAANRPDPGLLRAGGGPS